MIMTQDHMGSGVRPPGLEFQLHHLYQPGLGLGLSVMILAKLLNLSKASFLTSVKWVQEFAAHRVVVMIK